MYCLPATRSPLNPLLSCDAVCELFSEQTMIGHLCQVEKALTQAHGKLGLLSTVQADRAVQAIDEFSIDRAAMVDAARRDGVVVPELVRQLRAGVPEALHTAIHPGATSQDVIDTALTMVLRSVNSRFEQQIARVLKQLEALNSHFGDRTLMARTRMQPALPTRVSHRLQQWAGPLRRGLDQLPELRRSVECVQFGGPIGTRELAAGSGDQLADCMAKILGLHASASAWHTQRDALASQTHWLSLISASLGKLGQDMVLMAQPELAEITLVGSGQSSAMTHKANPVVAESLITLARFNAVQLSGMHHALIHEQERSGAAWSLEWMIVPAICDATGSALDNVEQLLASVETIGSITTRQDN